MNTEKPLWFWILGAACIIILVVLEYRSRKMKKEQSSTEDPKL
jgi:hypothetical protein